MAMIFIGILTAFFVYNDAKKRGQGTTGALFWSVGSIFVPYLILPLYLLLGRKTKKQSQYDGNDVIDIEGTVVEETMNCTKCGSRVNEDFSVCPYCQEPIDTGRKDN